MRPNVNLLAFVGALLLSGCLHPSATPPPPAANDAAATGPAVTSQLLHVYVECALPAESRERNRALAETVALTLRDQLRQRGYDVRGAESILPNGTKSTASGDAITQLGLLARTVADGTPPPTATRFATYLHTNAPRLVLFASLQPSDPETPRHKPALCLGGLLADTATGKILWSGQTTAHTNAENPDVRRLTAKLLANLDLGPPK